MVAHVGEKRLAEYLPRVRDLNACRLLNHRMTGPAGSTPPGRNDLIHRYVFPDGEPDEIAWVASNVQHAGFAARHAETPREYPALTLRAWVDSTERHYEEAVALIGERRTRIWPLYLAGSALGFEAGDIKVHQVLAVLSDGGRSRMPLRPDGG